MDDYVKMLAERKERLRVTRNAKLRERYHTLRQAGLAAIDAAIIAHWPAARRAAYLEQRRTRETIPE